MSLRRRIVISAGSNWILTFVNTFVALILVRIIITSIGETNFGIWCLLAFGLSYPRILENAFVLAMNRFAAFYRDHLENLNRFLSASFLILGSMAVIVLVVAVILSFFVSDIFAAIPPESAKDAQITCILVGFTLAAKMLGATFSGGLKGFQYYTRCNNAMIVGSLLRAILTVGLLFLWKSIIAVQLAHLVSASISSLLLFIVAQKSIIGLRVNFRLINKQTIRELWQYTYHSVARSGSSIVMYNTLNLLVGYKGTAVDVAAYNIALKIPAFLRGLLASAQVVFLPAVTTLFANKQIEGIKSVVKKATRISFVLTCASSIILFVFAKEILFLWLKDSVPEGTIRLMQMLIISMVPCGLFGIWLPVLVGMGYLRGLSIAAIATTLITIVLTLILFQTSIAITTVPAIALILVLWIELGLWLPLYGLGKLKICLREYLKDGLCQPLTATAVSIAAIWGLNYILPKENTAWLIRLTAFTAVIVVSFITISLRRETADLVAVVKRKIGGRKELR